MIEAPPSRIRLIPPMSPTTETPKIRLIGAPTLPQTLAERSRTNGTGFSHERLADGKLKIKAPAKLTVIASAIKIEDPQADNFAKALILVKEHLTNGEAHFVKWDKKLSEVVEREVAESMFRQWAQALIYEKRETFIKRATTWIQDQHTYRIPLTLLNVLNNGKRLFNSLKDEPLRKGFRGQPVHFMESGHRISVDSADYLVTIDAVRVFNELKEKYQRIRVKDVNGISYVIEIAFITPKNLTEEDSMNDRGVPVVYPAETLVEAHGVRYESKAPLMQLINHGEVNKDNKHVTTVGAIRTNDKNLEMRVKIEVETQKLLQAINERLGTLGLPSITMFLSCDSRKRTDGTLRKAVTRWTSGTSQGIKTPVLGFSGDANWSEELFKPRVLTYGTLTKRYHPDEWMQELTNTRVNGSPKLQHPFKPGAILYPIVEALFTKSPI